MSKWWNVVRRATAYTIPLLALAFFLNSHVAGAVTTVPTKMNFQGRLTNSAGNIMADGTYNMRLKLFTVSSGGSNVWSEDRLVSSAQGVTVTNGLFSIQLGDITPLSASLFASGALYLEVELPTPATATSSSPSWTEGAMTPRNQLATSAYAYNAETLDGLDSAAFGQLSQNNTWTGTNTIQGSNSSLFLIQNSSSDDVFKVDTTGEPGNQITNGSLEQNTTNWAARGGSTISRTTSTALYGSASLQVTTTAAANDGAKYNVSLSSSTQYTASIFAKLSSGSFTNMKLGYSSDGTTGNESDCKTNVTIVTGGWTQVNCTFTTGTVSGTPYFYIKQATAVARTFYIDGFHMVPGQNIGAYYNSTVRNAVVFDNLAVQNNEDSNTAFQVQASNGTSVFAVDTVNKRVGIGTNSPNSRMHIGTITNSSIGLIVKGVNSQSANLAEFQDNNNNALVSIGATGNVNVNSGLFSTDNANGGTINLLGNNSAETSSWSTSSNTFAATRANFDPIYYNGYAYVIGGRNASTAQTVYYAKVNANGSFGTWQVGTDIGSTCYNYAGTASQGYLFLVAGACSSETTQVYTAKINADGTLGTFINTESISWPMQSEAVSVANGYMYITGGSTATGGTPVLSTVYYAPIHPDGTFGTWQTSSNSIPAGRYGHKSVVANGYIYVIGGYNSGSQSTVYYAALNPVSGDVGTWTTASNALPSSLYEHTAVVSNGYLYVLGGISGTTYQSNVYYSRLNADGSLGTWSTAATTLPGNRAHHGSFIANGYVYVLGGYDGTSYFSTSYYARLGGVVNVGGSLDLVGLQGQNLVDGGDRAAGSTGGSITAGNITGVGNLQIQGVANFASTVSISGNIKVGDGIFAINSDQNRVRIGSSTADSTGVVLVLDTKNTSGDPSGGVDGAMYYNSNSDTYRCYNSGWTNCGTKVFTVSALSVDPVDATDYFFSNLGRNPATGYANNSMAVQADGTIYAATIDAYCSTSGSNQGWEMIIRKNNSTDYTIQTLNSSNQNRNWANTAMNVPVSVGDTISIKMVSPTWNTNPAGCVFGGTLYMQ